MSVAEGQQLLVTLAARVDAYERNIARARERTRTNFRAIEKQAETTSQKINKAMSGAMSNVGMSVRGQFGMLGGALLGGVSAQAIAVAAKEYQSLQNQLRVTGVEGDKLDGTMGRLFAIATRQGAALGPLIGLYAKLSLSQSELGISSEQLERFTEGIAVALRAGGVAAEKASGPLLQLSQALGGGVVRAEEFNSLLEGTPTIVQTVARGLTEAGGSVAKLRQLVNDGTVSSRAFFDAFMAGFPALAEQADRAEGAVDQSTTRIANALIMVVGKLDETTSASKNAAENLNAVAEVMAGMPAYIDAAAAGFQSLNRWLNEAGNNPIWRKLGEAMGVDYSPEGLAKAGILPVQPSRSGGIGSDRVAGGETSDANKVVPVSITNYPTNPATGTGGKTGNMLDLIGHAEGTDKARGYNETLAYGAYSGGPKNLVLMTLDEVDAMQTAMLQHPANTFNSSASGRYQITQRTLRGLRDSLGLQGDEYFDASMQDRLAQELLRQRGNDPAGLRNEWEGLRKIDDATIRAAYDGTSVSMPALDPNIARNAEAGRQQSETYQQLIADGERYRQSLTAEQQGLGMTRQAAAAMRYEQEMLNRAQQQGITLTPQQRQEIHTLAQGMGQAEVAAEELAKKQQAAAQMQSMLGNMMIDSFMGIVDGSMTAEQALQNFLKTLAKLLLQGALLGEGPLAGLFKGKAPATPTPAPAGGGGGGIGGIFGLIGGLFGFADGGELSTSRKRGAFQVRPNGQLRGPGTGRSDDILVWGSNGEFIVNAEATARNRRVLEMINSGAKLPAFADGGSIGAMPVPRLPRPQIGDAAAASEPQQYVEVTTNITVNGSAGTPEQNDDLTKRMARQMEGSIRGLICDELRRQMRPANMLNNRRL